jgi:CRISPR/Cas system Type II protein with McrA/HNH and RuvC-like nuclease domain
MYSEGGVEVGRENREVEKGKKRIREKVEEGMEIIDGGGGGGL